MAMTASPVRTTMTLRAKPMPVKTGNSTYWFGRASRGSRPGMMPMVWPPSLRAPRQAASMTPPRPPQTTVAPRRAISRPTVSAPCESLPAGRPRRR